jgi:hypothetical protein
MEKTSGSPARDIPQNSSDQEGKDISDEEDDDEDFDQNPEEAQKRKIFYKRS